MPCSCSEERTSTTVAVTIARFTKCVALVAALAGTCCGATAQLSGVQQVGTFSDVFTFSCEQHGILAQTPSEPAASGTPIKATITARVRIRFTLTMINERRGPGGLAW